jgi:hypothetical protein
MLCTTLVYLRPVNECVSRTFSYHVALWVYVGPYNILVCEEPIHNTCPLLAKQTAILLSNFLFKVTHKDAHRFRPSLLLLLLLSDEEVQAWSYASSVSLSRGNCCCEYGRSFCQDVTCVWLPLQLCCGDDVHLSPFPSTCIYCLLR